jgi:Rieske Fe-S protein
MPGINTDTSELVKAYEWWSLSDQVQAAAESARRPSAAPPDERAKQQLPFMNEVDWTAEPLSSDFKTRGRNQKSSQRKMSRRKIFAFIAAGGVAVAGTALFLNFGHGGVVANPPAGQTETGAAKQPMNGNNKPAAQPQANDAVPTTPANKGQTTQQNAPVVKKGTVIGSTKQATNTGVDFVNPADNQHALLINLPGNNFVAFERACTHEGVTVNYDPGTKMLVCPAHGAIFNPATGGSVQQGPAEQPLPQVHIMVNGDGTITAV